MGEDGGPMKRWGAFIFILGIFSNYSLAEEASDGQNRTFNKLIRASSIEEVRAHGEVVEKLKQIDGDDSDWDGHEASYEVALTIPKRKGAILATRAPASLLPNFSGIAHDIGVMLVPSRK